jgi:tetratricopeptide (TPR) repeat protein
MTETLKADLANADVDTLFDLADQAVIDGREAEVVDAIRDGAARLQSSVLWQWTGLLQRSLDRHAEALESFTTAARLDPSDPRIAQGLAHTALEAGIPAVALYEEARRLDPKSGPIVIALAAARVAAGEGEQAAAELAEILERKPFWLLGHTHLAQIVATLGRPAEATQSLERALARYPNMVPLWETLLNVQLRRGAYETLRPILVRATSAGVTSPEFAIYEAIDLAEHDSRDFPPALFDQAPPGLDATLDTWRVRHLLRIGKPEAALPILDRGLRGPQSAELWAYAATVWRMVGDPRSKWLEGDPALVGVIDLNGKFGDRERLAEVLRSLHVARGEYLDQSVRGGTQTDGPLFSRIEPEIQALRSAILEAVDGFRKSLPPPDPAHPFLSQRRDRPIRFAGSWSVRLRSNGRHSNHVHPQGWISSAFYVSLPQRAAGEPGDAGWFTLGSPDDRLGLELEPWRKIEPREGQLVLFPSWMWHGTLPFRDGERLTVAFDVAPPR